MTMQPVMNTGFRLPLTIEQVEDGSYMATSLHLPGLLVLAETIEEIFQLAPDIAKELIEAMKEKGIQPPISLGISQDEFYGRKN
jgi:predicted RNase H-like HicB family nuclease